MAFSLDTCTQPGTPLINGFVAADDVMATRHLRHRKILQGKVRSREVH